GAPLESDLVTNVLDRACGFPLRRAVRSKRPELLRPSAIARHAGGARRVLGVRSRLYGLPGRFGRSDAAAPRRRAEVPREQPARDWAGRCRAQPHQSPRKRALFHLATPAWIGCVHAGSILPTKARQRSRVQARSRASAARLRACCKTRSQSAPRRIVIN